MLRWAIAAGLLVGLASDTGFGAQPLPKRQQTQLTGIVNAARFAGPVEIVKAAAPVAAKVSDSHLEAINEKLANEVLPSVGELLAFSRIRLELSNQSQSVPKPKFRERMRMLTAIADDAEKSLTTAQQTLAQDVTLPIGTTMDAFETRLRLIAARRRNMQSALRTTQFARELIAEIPPRSLQRLKGTDAAAVKRNGSQRIDELQQTARDLFELQLALRLKRLDYGIQVLKETTGKLTKERFLVAQSTGLDGRFLQNVLREAQAADKPGKDAEPDKPAEPAKPHFKREELNDPQLAASIAAKTKQAEELAGDLAIKARHFFEGLDWWLRGRFGSGPEVVGLVKSAQSLKRPELLYQVHMPIELPKPLAPTNLVRLRPNHIDRRHHYTWNWEDRKLVRQAYFKYNPWPESAFGMSRNPPHVMRGSFDQIDAASRPMTAHSRGVDTKFKSVHLPPQDPRLVYRLVGFVEYSKSLEHLDQFVESASLRELEVADEIVRDNDQFIIHTNLSRRLEKQPNVLSERGRNERDDFARHGLPWVLGLARIELGAMLAGFTTAKEPFRLMVPPQKSPRIPERYGAREFYELLVDGMRTHYWSLKSDPEVWNYRKTGVPEHHLVTYTRRVTVARQFLVSARDASTGLFTEAQLKLAGQWEQEIASVHRMLVYCLAKKQGSESRVVRHFFTNAHPDYYSKNAKFSRERQVNRSSIPEQLELIDPTLKFCQCQ